MFSIFQKRIILFNPFDGAWMNLEDVPDEVFSKRLIGDGFAITPVSNLLVSPVCGKIVQIFPTNHALGIVSKEGIEVLIHIGIDTVELKGEGFKRLAEVGQVVDVGTPLIEIDLTFIKSRGKSLITPVLITNGKSVKSMKLLNPRGIAGITQGIELQIK